MQPNLTIGDYPRKLKKWLDAILTKENQKRNGKNLDRVMITLFFARSVETKKIGSCLMN